MIYQLNNITKDLGDFSLKIDKLCLEEGKIYAVTGPNGCGKTTFLNLLSFLDQPEKGEIIFSDKVTDYSKKSALLSFRRGVGYLLQNPYLFNMSVYDNVAYGLKVRAVDDTLIKSKVGEMLDYFSISDLAKRNIGKLSGGEAQRVVLARTFILDSKVFLLDEPTANVDKNNVRVVEDLIVSLSVKRNATIIFTTHSQSQAYRMTKNIISIINGQIKDIAYENVFSGALNSNDSGVSYMQLSGGVNIAVGSCNLDKVTIAIDPVDIILSKEHLDSSALNSFCGTISRLENMAGLIRVFVDVGVEFCAIITEKSFYNMGLNIGNKVWVTFKASAVKVV